jgi:hypothetical protein
MTPNNWFIPARVAVFPSPVVCRGNHPHPSRGVCLTEFAATLPGGAWTDHPAGMQPMLGVLARAVNDATSDQTRMALLPWAAWLVGTAGSGGDEALGLTIATRTGAVALRHADRSVAQRLAPVMARLAWDEPATAGRLRRRWHTAARRRAAAKLIRASIAAVAAADRHPDEMLRAMLAEAVNTAREGDGLPAVDVNVCGHLAWPTSQPIRVEVRIPDGGESRYEYCTALPGRWPAALTDAWTCRRRELRRLAVERRPE